MNILNKVWNIEKSQNTNWTSTDIWFLEPKLKQGILPEAWKEGKVRRTEPSAKKTEIQYEAKCYLWETNIMAKCQAEGKNIIRLELAEK